MLAGLSPSRGAGALSILAWLLASAAACSTFDDPPLPPSPTDVSWSKSFGDELPQEANAVVADAFGNVYVAGSFEGEADFGGGVVTAAGGSDVFLAKYDTNGQHLWSRRLGDESWQRGTAMALDSSGNPVIVGSFSGAIEFAGEFLSASDGSDAFVVMFDPDGGQVFGKAFEGTMQERPQAVAVDAATGDIVIGGDFNGELTIGGDVVSTSGGRDMFVMRLDAAGEPLWYRSFGHPAGDDTLTSLDVDLDGNVAITGYTPGEIDFGGGPLLTIGIDPNDDAVVAVLDAAGGHLWSKRLGDAQYQRGFDVAFLPSGELLSIGSFSGNINFGGTERTSTGGFDVYVAKLSTSGDPVWSRSYGISDEQQGYRIEADRQGNVLLAGDFRGEVDFGGEQMSSEGDYDVYLAKLDAEGDHLASLRFGDEDEQRIGDLTVDSAGNAIVVGRYFGTIDFGFGEHTSAGEDDPFVAKLAITP